MRKSYLIVKYKLVSCLAPLCSPSFGPFEGFILGEEIVSLHAHSRYVETERK